MQAQQAAYSAPDEQEATQWDLSEPPGRIRTKAAAAQQSQLCATTTSSSNGSACSSACSVVVPTFSPDASSDGSGSAHSEASTGCWVTAIMPHKLLDHTVAGDGFGAAHVHSNLAGTSSTITTNSSNNSSRDAAQEAAAAGVVVPLATAPMHDLASLLSGCPSRLHAAFMHTAAALAEQHKQAQQQQQQYMDSHQQDFILAQQGCGGDPLSTSQLHSLLQQQQAQRYSLLPIAAIPLLLAEAVPGWCGADVGYAALQIRCHLNIIANFTLDIPVAAAAAGAGAGAGGGDAQRTPRAAAGKDARSADSSNCRLGECMQQQGVVTAAAAAEPPCDLMYAELASTILAAASTEAAVAEHQLPPAVQALLLDFAAELSSSESLQHKLQATFAAAATATPNAAHTSAASGMSSSVVLAENTTQQQQSEQQGASTQHNTEEPLLPVVKAVKVLCRLLVGAAGLSDIRLLAWLACMVRQQHMVNNRSNDDNSNSNSSWCSGESLASHAHSAAAADSAAAAALISCDQLLHVLGQLVEQLGGGAHRFSAGHEECWQGCLADAEACAGIQPGSSGWAEQLSLLPQGPAFDAAGGGILPTRAHRANYRSSSGSPTAYEAVFGTDAVSAYQQQPEAGYAGGFDAASVFYNNNSSSCAAVRAAHRPLSTCGSLGADVWGAAAADIMAAAGVDCNVDTDLSLLPPPPSYEDAVQQYSSTEELRSQLSWPLMSLNSHGSTRHSRNADRSRAVSSGGGSSSKTKGLSRLARLSLPSSPVGGSSSNSRWPDGGVIHSDDVGSGAAASVHDRHTTAVAAGTTWHQHEHHHHQHYQQQQQQQHDERVAQQHAWHAEMLLEHQPWEGAVSPMAGCYTQRWAGAFGGQVLHEDCSHMAAAGCGGRGVVNILRIS